MAQSRLLIADDDEIILAIFGKGLRNAGYDVEEAKSGEEALKIVAEKKIDLAILDVNMPGLSGIETAHMMKDHKVPVIFLSAHDGSEIVEAAAAEGALGYIIKPIDVVKMVPTIETALERADELRISKEAESRLSNALDTGQVVNIVVGMLMERYRVNQDQAFEVLRKKARSERRKVRDVAVDIINAWELLNQLAPDHSSTGKTKH